MADILFVAARALFEAGLDVEVRRSFAPERIELVGRTRIGEKAFHCGRTLNPADIDHARLVGPAAVAAEIVDWMQREFGRALKRETMGPR